MAFGRVCVFFRVMNEFKLVANFEPKGDQPEAIEALLAGLHQGQKYQTLLGVTGSGKTFTMANVIARYNRPTLVMSHNKTLAAQLYGEMQGRFSPTTPSSFSSAITTTTSRRRICPRPTPISKKTPPINEDIDRLRLRATSSLLERRRRRSSSLRYRASTVSARPGLQNSCCSSKSASKSIATDHPLADRHALQSQRHRFLARQLPRPRRHRRTHSGLPRRRPPDRIVRRPDRTNYLVSTRSPAKSSRKKNGSPSIPAKHFVTTPIMLEKAVKSHRTGTGERLEQFRSPANSWKPSGWNRAPNTIWK